MSETIFKRFLSSETGEVMDLAKVWTPSDFDYTSHLRGRIWLAWDTDRPKMVLIAEEGEESND